MTDEEKTAAVTAALVPFKHGDHVHSRELDRPGRVTVLSAARDDTHPYWVQWDVPTAQATQYRKGAWCAPHDLTLL